VEINVFGLASAAIQSVHTDRAATLHSWASETKSDTGKITHTYNDSTVSINDQAISADRLQHIEGIDQSKTYRKIYLTSASGTISIKKGFDVIEISTTEKYKIEQLLEDWTLNGSGSAWCCVLGVRL
jgi:hypothetical protein